MVEHILFGVAMVLLVSLLLIAAAPLWMAGLAVVGCSIAFYFVVRGKR